MSFENIFTGGADRASTAERSANTIHDTVPGARPERSGIDPELYDGIPDEPRDPKIVSELSPEALTITGDILAPLFQKFRSLAEDQRAASEDPATTSGMARATRDEAAKDVRPEIDEEDAPG
ncbi:hypothetical protein ACL03H_01040 [Saccharopolyspora sp. MS10]|uniref:hypothetical protein n=1 Tax=Saccharopolyspora sp. MS10 TaxID=3385973 RepID=UPI0039A31D9E